MRRLLQVVLLAVAVLASAGSVATVGGGKPQIYFSPAVNHGYPPKPENCPIVVLSAPPSQAYEELGTFDIDYRNVAYDSNDVIRTAYDLGRVLGPRACAMGADAIWAAGMIQGAYTRGVALRWVAPAPTVSPPVAAPAPTVAPAPAPAPAEPAPAPAPVRP